MDECKPLAGAADAEAEGIKTGVENGGRGLRSSTFRLNVSTFCWIRWVHGFPQSIRQGDMGRC